ncbi:MAG TPA: TIGR04255 family protein [Nostocaceae cyanobacterium]|nr:TIGR04255 family protein [Nostocaceae cyanobacterium]
MTVVKFKNSPLVETVFTVIFDAPGFSSIHFGLYWESIRDGFPLQKDASPLEVEDDQDTFLPRVLFLSADRRKMIQLQENCFIFNYEVNNQSVSENNKISDFFDLWDQLENWWKNYSQEPINIHRYQLAYLNVINKPLGWESTKDHSKIFRVIKPNFSNTLGIPNSLDFKMQFSLPKDLGELYLQAEQVSTSDDEEEEGGLTEDSIHLQLVASSIDATIPLKHWFISANEYTVKAFLDITTEEAQKIWGSYNE